MTTDTEEMPELATNEHWRGVMTRARKEHGLSQEQLAEEVGVSQVMISKLETVQASSKFIMRICRRLSIPPPEHYEDDELRAWNELGRLLRARDPEQYEAQLRSLKVMAARLKEPAASVADEPTHPENRTRRQ